MACRGDYQGVWFTLQALGLYFAEIAAASELVIVDNDPATADGQRIARLAKAQRPHWSAVVYVPFDRVQGTAQPRNEVFAHATGEAVLCLDPHVLLWPGALEWLLAWHAAHPDSRDLLTGPCFGATGLQGTDQTPVWGGAWPAFGRWRKDPRGLDPEHPPFAVDQQGLGCFSMRRAAWPGFNRLLRGWGGCETGLCERVRQRGGEVLCCPRLRWTHYFRPGGAAYEVSLVDRFRNYLIDWISVGLDTSGILEAFAGKIPQHEAERVVAEVGELLRSGQLEAACRG